MPDIFYFAFQARNVYEGGMARNNAFHNKFRELGARILNVYCKNKAVRLIKFFRALIILIFLNKKKIFIHQGSILVLFPFFLFNVMFLFAIRF